MLMMLASGSLDLLSKHMIQGFYEVLQAFLQVFRSLWKVLQVFDEQVLRGLRAPTKGKARAADADDAGPGCGTLGKAGQLMQMMLSSALGWAGLR